MARLKKLSKRKKKSFQVISGIGFLIVGLYMMFILKDIKGQIPLILGIAILLWRF